MGTERWPPSGTRARFWTFAGLLAPILLPVAIVYQRRAYNEAEASLGQWEWPRRLLNRPVLLYVLVWLGFFVILFVLAAVLSAFGVPPI
jgi:hypothetical protein